MRGHPGRSALAGKAEGTDKHNIDMITLPAIQYTSIILNCFLVEYETVTQNVFAD